MEIVMLNNPSVYEKMTFQSFDENKTTVVLDNKEFKRLEDEARQAGYEAGYAAGFFKAENDTRAFYETGIVHALNAIQNELTQYRDFQELMKTKINDQLAYFFKVILQKMFPHLLKKHGFAEILLFIESMQTILLAHERICIKVGPAMNTYIHDYIPTLHDFYCILEQDDFPPFACQITWPNGGVDLDLEQKHKKLSDSIENFFKE
ncbi:MAG: hypothetical protein CNLJKLNK_00189 [Holosporales bacterium]